MEVKRKRLMTRLCYVAWANRTGLTYIAVVIAGALTSWH